MASHGSAGRWGAVALVIGAACGGSGSGGENASERAQAPRAVQVSVVASGLLGPRGLAFGPDGQLYVAEAGQGGARSTVGSCPQVPVPVGPYTGGLTGRVSRIDAQGNRTTVADGLPSAKGNELTGGNVTGVASVAFLGGQLYALVAGGGCSHGNPDWPNGVVRIDAGGAVTRVADLSAFWQANPVAHPEADDFEPDGDPFSMIVVDGSLVVVEANHGEVDRVAITPGPVRLERIADLSASLGHVVPTSVAWDRSLLVGNLGTFPVVPGSEQIFRVTLAGQVGARVQGLSTVLGLAVDRGGQVYALESITAPGLPGPASAGTGRVVRITATGPEIVADGLTFPTAMTFGPDGALYVSNKGFGVPPGAGEILRITGL